MHTIKVTLEYDGSAYTGWQRQPHHPTIQATVETVLSQITQAPTTVVAAGRTDTGVHALGQVISFRSEKTLSSHQWRRALNGLLPVDICARVVERVPEDFHARYHAREKFYEYRILNRPYRSALYRNRVWHIPTKLDVERMKQAAQFCIGEHNFSSFQGSHTDNKNPFCRINQFTLFWKSPYLRIQIHANRFLKQMVRTMVGTLVGVGLGKAPPTAISEILQATDRRTAGKTAPPQGLYLVKVLY